MKLKQTKTSVVLAIAVSMVMAMVPSGAKAFVVHAQRTTSPPVYDSTTSQAFSADACKIAPAGYAPVRRSLPPTTALSTAATAVLPGPLAAAAVIPTCLGLWRTGFAVSYGYGVAMLASGAVQFAAFLEGSSGATLPLKLHAALYVFYGARLCSFLFHRARTSSLVQMKRKDATLAERLKRIPLLLGCSGLYYCMAAAPMKILASTNPVASLANAAALAVGGSGFLLAAVGDWYKSRIKARDGPDTLVTTGPFRYLRHPNYTGEMIGWTSVCVLVPALSLGKTSPSSVVPLALSALLGWAGMVFAVLGDATLGLEKKHREKYGGTPEYEAWVKSSWSGPMVGKLDGDAPAGKEE